MHDAADDLFDSLFRSSVLTKPALSMKQEEEMKRMLFEIVSRKAQLPGEDEDDVKFFFDKAAVSPLVDELRYESPYGNSARGCLLEALCKYDLSFDALVSGKLSEYLLQYTQDERELHISADGTRRARWSRIDDFATIQKQVGSVHRYVTLFHFLVEVAVSSLLYL